jgi:amino acid transporter
VPMLIMALLRSQIASLITASCAVLIVALSFSEISSAKPQELLGPTAPYAAVLVAFGGVCWNQPKYSCCVIFISPGICHT